MVATAEMTIPDEYKDRKIIGPQKGPQTMFATTPADFAIYGGAAGGGKSFGLLLECLRWIMVAGFSAVMFRRTFPMIKNPGGLWDTSQELFPHVGGVAIESKLKWLFGPQSVSFHHMQHEKNKIDWQGSQIPLIGFDELTHFSKSMVMYMWSRNRSTCGVKPYMRATCNPDYGSWVREFIAWWIDEKTGFPIPERDGVLRWLVRDGDNILWFSSFQEALPHCKVSEETGEPIMPKSVTFIKAKVTDNRVLMRADPGYLSNLHALPLYERSQLLEGNWNVRPVAGMFFQRGWFSVIEKDKVPAGGKIVRYWDRAATEQGPGSPDPDWTVGLKMKYVRTKESTKFYVLDVCRIRMRPEGVLRTMKNIAQQDGLECEQIWEQDPGQAGKVEVSMLYQHFTGLHVRAVPVHANKLIRAKPASSSSEAGNIVIVRGAWNNDFLDELEAFADWDQVEHNWAQKPHDDQVDAFSGAYTALANNSSVGGGSF